MGKRSTFTLITPLPSTVPRQLALDLLHSHKEVIEVNPLVTGVRAIDAPRESPSDEYYSAWYEITQVITWGFGIKKKIGFKGVFHDQPWGLQTHTYAPMGVDLRIKYRIGGSQPGEPREPKELGVDTPQDGLYLREDVEIVCNVPLTTGFVKKETKSAIGIMVDRMVRKAELLDEGRLHAMFEDGKLKTSKPSGAPTFEDRPLPSPGTPPGSPPAFGSTDFKRAETFSAAGGGMKSPALDSKGFGRYRDLVARSASTASSARTSAYLPAYQQAGYQGPEYARPGAELSGVQESGGGQNFVSELPGSYYHAQDQNNLYPQPLKSSGQQSFVAELPGDSSLQAPGVQDVKPTPTPPNATHPAYQQRSPQPSPRLPSGGQQPNSSPPNRNSSYRVSNPDPPRPEGSRQSSQSNSMQDWQRSVAGDQPIDSSYYRNGRDSNSGPIEPDHQRFSTLSVQKSVDDRDALPSRVSKCPVCGLFEGDEAAVSHHVSKAHFQ